MIQKDDQDLMNLWIKYKKHMDLESRNQIIIHYTPLVKKIVGRLAVKYRDYVDVDDLISYGVLGLIDAVEKFDLEKGAQFETYASFRIRGSIIDEIREQDWVPRNLRTKAKRIEEALEGLEIKLGRQVKEQELAQYLNIPLEELQKVMGQLHSFTVISLEDQILEVSGSSVHFNETPKTPEEHIMVSELKSLLIQAIDSLDEKEKKIISLYYFDELTLKEIGSVIGVSESRVSQLHTRILMKLKNKLSRFGSILV